MKAIVAYCRTACEPDGASCAVCGQAQEIQRYAARRGLTVSMMYMDAGVSRITLERPELQRLIVDCRAGEIATVITKDAARLSRDTGQLILLMQIFQKAGVRVEFSAREGRGDPFLESIVTAVSEIEEAKIWHRCRAARWPRVHSRRPPAC